MEMESIYRYNKAWKDMRSRLAKQDNDNETPPPKETAKERKARLWKEKLAAKNRTQNEGKGENGEEE